jgi:hypothetical protein
MKTNQELIENFKQFCAACDDHIRDGCLREGLNQKEDTLKSDQAQKVLALMVKLEDARGVYREVLLQRIRSSLQGLPVPLWYGHWINIFE